jgi:hypothetical protein
VGSAFDLVVRAAAPGLTSAYGDASITYTPTGSPTVSTWTHPPIFDRDRAATELQADTQVSQQRPTLSVWVDDLGTDPAQGDLAVVAAVTYEVADVRADGHGWARLAMVVAP